jgi:electron transport complex protein RnfG
MNDQTTASAPALTTEDTPGSSGFSFEAIREKFAYQPVLLGAIALIASLSLAIAARATHEPIASAEARDLQDSLSQVLPAGYAQNNLLQDTVEIDRDGTPVKLYLARQDGKVAAGIFQVAERGYSGEISVLMAVDLEGKVLGVRVLKHTETPGLGDKIEAAKSNWVESFKGHSFGNPPEAQWAVKKDGGIFDQFAGATITPRAVVKAVKGGMTFFLAHRDELAKR